MEKKDGTLEVKIGRHKKRFPFTIRRISYNRLSLVLDYFGDSDKWAIKSLLSHLNPDKIFIAVYSRYISSKKITRYYFALYTFSEDFSSLIKNNSITIPCTLHLGGWDKSYDLGVKFIIRFNEKGIFKIFNRLI